jgi:hypothetical protein
MSKAYRPYPIEHMPLAYPPVLSCADDQLRCLTHDRVLTAYLGVSAAIVSAITSDPRIEAYPSSGDAVGSDWLAT